MKKIYIFLVITVINTFALANIFDDSLEYKKFQKTMNPKEQAIFEKVFNGSDKLIDSYRAELKTLNSSDYKASKRREVVLKKIKMLEEMKYNDLASLEQHLKANPKRHLIE